MLAVGMVKSQLLTFELLLRDIRPNTTDCLFLTCKVNVLTYLVSTSLILVSHKIGRFVK